ncbi:MAG: hypothetical protein ACXWDO_00790 [Bacteroidia bacterium]
MKITFSFILIVFLSGCGNYNLDFKDTERDLADFEVVNNILLSKHKTFQSKDNYEPGFNIQGNYLPTEILDFDSLNLLKSIPTFKYIIVHRPEFIQYVLKQERSGRFIFSDKFEHCIIYSKFKDEEFEKFLSETAKHQESRINWRKQYDSNWTYVVFKEFAN